MSRFVHVVEVLSDPTIGKTGESRINAILETLQEKGAKIVDVKLNTCMDVCRTYLILYEAPGHIEM